jgi:glutathione S-transferase
MKLYSLALSPFAARVRGAIFAKDLPIEIVAPPAEWRSSAEFRALSPLGKIPGLVLDDGTALPESAVIVEYLEDAFPEPSLRPRAAEDRARVRLVTQVAELYVMPAMMPLFFLFDAKPRDESAIATQLGKLGEALGHLDRLLKPGSHAFGGQLTTADLFLAPLRFALDGLKSFSGRQDLLDPHKAVDAYSGLAQGDPILARIWAEMSEGLKSFFATRGAATAD